MGQIWTWLECPCWPPMFSGPPVIETEELDTPDTREILLQTTNREGVTTEYQRTVDPKGNVHEFQISKSLSREPIDEI